MSEPIARDTLLNDLATDQSKGSVVHTFKPNASTAEKAASAGKAASKLKRVSDDDGFQPQGKHLRASLREPAHRSHWLRCSYSVLTSTCATCLNTALKVVGGAAGALAPVTVTSRDVEKANRPDEEPSTPVGDETQVPGALTDSTPPIPAWYKVGWRDVTGVDAPIPTGEEHDRQIISMFISEQVWHLCSPYGDNQQV